MTGKKKVSIIIVTCNQGEFITNALESVLKQSVPSELYEILVVDDGSTDNTAGILRAYGKQIRVIKQENQGPIKATNVGLTNAQGEYIIKLDADDTFEPTIVAEMVNVLESNEDVGFVYSDYYEKNIETGEMKVISLKDNIFNSIAIGIMFRREVLEDLGMYDESLIFPEYDLLIKAIKKYKGKHIPHGLFTYYRHKGSLTADPERVRIGKEQLFQKYGVIEGLRDY